MNVDENNHIVEFEEKPKKPKSNLASMGVYIFTWKVLREYLIADDKDPKSKNDFGKNIIPNMLRDEKVMLAYAFENYWKDVGTIASLWEANMDLLKVPPEFDLNDPRWKIYARSPIMPPHFIGGSAVVEQSLIAEGCEVHGTVKGSVLFAGVNIASNAIVEDSVIRRSIVSENCVISSDCVVGELEGDIALIGQDTTLPEGYVVKAGEQVDTEEITRREAETHE